MLPPAAYYCYEKKKNNNDKSNSRLFRDVQKYIRSIMHPLIQVMNSPLGFAYFQISKEVFDEF
jgi:hypothetical protein